MLSKCQALCLKLRYFCYPPFIDEDLRLPKEQWFVQVPMAVGTRAGAIDEEPVLLVVLPWSCPAFPHFGSHLDILTGRLARPSFPLDFLTLAPHSGLSSCFRFFILVLVAMARSTTLLAPACGNENEFSITCTNVP